MNTPMGINRKSKCYKCCHSCVHTSHDEYGEEQNLYCSVKQELVYTKDGENCEHYKGEKERQEESRHKKAVEIADEILSYIFNERFSRVSDYSNFRNEFIEIIKRHL